MIRITSIMAAIYEDELIEEPHRRETSLRGRRNSFLFIFWGQDEMKMEKEHVVMEKLV